MMPTMQTIQRPRPQKRPKRQPDWLVRVLLLAFLLSAGVTAVLLFTTVRDFITSTTALQLPGIDLPSGGSAGSSQGGEGESRATPQSLTSSQLGPQLEPWDGASRVTMLVMGMDYRDWVQGDGPSRTDTMILLTVDPNSRTAGMLSIPRDLWVDIPNFGHAKINTAYQLGEAAQLPGGGPGLAIETVQNFLGIKINYYAIIDFSTFERFIDTIGGVKIDVPEDLRVTRLGAPNAQIIPAGRHTLPGDLALAYARNRDTEGADFDRAQRQQQVILAMRDRLLEPSTQARILTNALEIYQDLSSGIRTNLTFDEALQLGMLATQINLKDIQKGVISTPEQVILATSPDGLQILKPVPEKIRLLRDEIFTSAGATGPSDVCVNSLADCVIAEGANVAVYNGTLTAGLAGSTQEYLVAQGLNVAEIGNAQQVASTTIYFYTSKPYTVQFLVDLMGIQKNKIFSGENQGSDIDVAVILGPDWSIP